MAVRWLRDINQDQLINKVVLVRSDLNVPMVDGKVSASDRLNRFIPTLKYLLSNGAKVVIISHLGRPKGKPDTQFSLAPIATSLGNIAGCNIKFCPEITGEVAQNAIKKLAKGEAILLENLRFDSREEQNDAAFAKQLALGCDIYVNDAFSCSHRSHASIDAITTYLPAYGGMGMQSEVTALTNALNNPKKPVAAIVGGAKISSKIAILNQLIHKVDYLIIGGGMANTFLASSGCDMGKSLVEPNALDIAREIMSNAQRANCNFILPSDVVVAEHFSHEAEINNVEINNINTKDMALDIGENSCDRIISLLNKCNTLLWNGPLGAFEIDQFAKATIKVARHAARLTETNKILSVGGGGDTVAALEKAGVTHNFSYISAAGGAFLEWLEGKELPGITALQFHLNQ